MHVLAGIRVALHLKNKTFAPTRNETITFKMSGKLVTIPASHFCERARWALQRYGVSFKEERKLPYMHYLSTKRLGGSSTPLLSIGGTVLKNSGDILRYVDEKYAKPKGQALYPTEDKVLKEVKDIEELLETRFATQVRQYQYFCLLNFKPERDRLKRRGLFLEDGLPITQKFVSLLALPFVRHQIGRDLNMSMKTSDIAQKKFEEVLEQISKVLEDGRPFLAGDSFTAADLTFASFAAPIVFPPEYGGTIPSVDMIPGFMRTEVEGYRETLAGKHALRMYKDERRKVL
eukprot:Colp12_sorted_trinity150504_noHs@31442